MLYGASRKLSPAEFTPGAVDEIVRALSGGDSSNSFENSSPSAFFSRHLSEYSDYRRVNACVLAACDPVQRASRHGFIFMR